MTDPRPLPDHSADYDSSDDLRASIEFAYRHIRERVARGGRGWREWPSEPIAAVLNPLESRRE